MLSERFRRDSRSTSGAPTLGAVAIGLFVFLRPGEALAYLDAGSASMVFQALIASVLGGMAVAKVYWGKIKTFWTRGEEPSEGAAERDDAG